jgi:hypothetical protein
MDDGGGIGIEAPPAGFPIEGDNPVIRSEDGPRNVAALKRVLDSFTVAAPKLVVEVHHAIAVELHAGVDKRPHMLKDKKAAEGIVVEHSLPSQLQGTALKPRSARRRRQSTRSAS